MYGYLLHGNEVFLRIDIIELETFKRSVKKQKINRNSVDLLKTELCNNPEKGDLIPGSGGLRKIRMGIYNTGKRGGARVIYLYPVSKERIYLITSYKKTDRENLTHADLKAFRRLIKTIENME